MEYLLEKKNENEFFEVQLTKKKPKGGSQTTKLPKGLGKMEAAMIYGSRELKGVVRWMGEGGW